MLLQRGARILLRTLRTEDPLRGTELLLTAAGRATLTELYRAQIEVAGEPAQSGGPVDVVRPVRLDDDGAGRNPRERRRVKRRFVDPL